MQKYLWIVALMLVALMGRQVSGQVPIPVVHTWGDLENAPKFTVVPTPWVKKGDKPAVHAPVTFQVGIQGNEGSSYSGILFYFMTQNTEEANKIPEQRGIYSLGLFHKGIQLSLIRDGPNDQLKPLAINSRGTIFYAETIPIFEAGDYIVKLVKSNYDESVDVKYEVLAQATVTVQDHPQNLWYQWWPYPDPKSEVSAATIADSIRNADGTQYSVLPVMNPKGGSAVPQTSSPQFYRQLPAPDLPLPSLFPTHAENSPLHLKMIDSKLIVNFDQKILGFFPNNYFLTRWWVNGKQVNLDPALRLPDQMVIVEEQMWYTQEVHFDLHFQPGRLGASKGDRVGVQLLFCPHGLETRLDFPENELFDGITLTPASNFSEISNRIDFIYSGDPDHPQQ